MSRSRVEGSVEVATTYFCLSFASQRGRSVVSYVLPQHFFKPPLLVAVSSPDSARLELAQKIIRGVAGVAARLARITESGHPHSIS
jgi:hypothetical protein